VNTDDTIHVFINGTRRPVSAGSTVASVIQQLDIEPKYVAVEVNLELVPRHQHAGHQLQDGDRLEVVTLVGGG